MLCPLCYHIEIVYYISSSILHGISLNCYLPSFGRKCQLKAKKKKNISPIEHSLLQPQIPHPKDLLEITNTRPGFVSKKCLNLYRKKGHIHSKCMANSTGQFAASENIQVINKLYLFPFKSVFPG